jgi:hypothetical protein
MKSGIVGNVKWNRAPKKFVLNQDPDLANTSEDPYKFLKLRNSILNLGLTKARTPWCGAYEKSDVFFQILIEACSSDRSIVTDLSAGTRSSLRACRAFGRHFFGLEDDNDIFEELLKPLTMPKRGEGYLGRSRKRRGDSGNILSKCCPFRSATLKAASVISLL